MTQQLPLFDRLDLTPLPRAPLGDPSTSAQASAEHAPGRRCARSRAAGTGWWSFQPPGRLVDDRGVLPRTMAVVSVRCGDRRRKQSFFPRGVFTYE